MENDPGKKESKGKRILKRALRRNSKSSNNNSNSTDDSASVSLTKSENNNNKIDDNDVRENKKENDASKATEEGLDRKQNFAQPARVDATDGPKKMSAVRFQKRDERSLTDSAKKGVKRKLEEESGAGTSGASTGASDTDADDKDPSKDKKKKNRCAVCRKKVGLTGFECRCGGLFCAVHRYSDKHECSFDYRELGAQEIRRNNPVVVSQKIHKI